MTATFERAAQTRIDTISTTSEETRRALAQHLTPPEVAELAVSLFTDSDEPLRCLDLGGGTGILSVALVERYGGLVRCMDTVEQDPGLAHVYDTEVRGSAPGKTIVGDALVVNLDCEPTYERIILNPPYKKMAAADPRHAALPLSSPNLYSAFVLKAIEHLSEGGEIVAIIPRSWTNGEYFLPFRRYVFSRCSLDALHLYGSRNEVFSDTHVLQETMLVRFSKRPQAERVRVSHSAGKTDAPTVDMFDASELIVGDDYVVRVAPEKRTNLADTVESVGLCPSTGKVVDFRCKDLITDIKPENRHAVPLIYVGNFQDGRLEHPRSFGKGQWFCPDNETAAKQLCHPGAYVVVKRFSAKEERRRVVAYPLVVEEPVALENHSSFLHQGKPRKVVPLRSAELAYGLSIWLNTTFIDEWFRGVSGSTQVNAGDIKKMPCPPLDILETLGRSWSANLTQEQIDAASQGVLR